MRIPWSLYADSTFLFLYVLAYASVLPRNDKTTITDVQVNRGPAMLPQHPWSQGSQTSDYVSSRQTGVMVKRDDEQDDDLWVRTIQIISSTIPYRAAAPFLEQFYLSILYNALESWTSQPPQQKLFVTIGRLQLTMQVALDTGVRQGIPWAFVRNFARNMLMMTRLGFVGTYDMFFMRHYNPHSPILIVEVRLRISWDV